MSTMDNKLKIERIVEDRIFEQEFRDHLGASSLGGVCNRASWYGFRWVTKKIFIARIHRLLNRGHSEELVVIADLIEAGCRIKGINIDDSIHDRFKILFNHQLPRAKQRSKKFSHGHGGSSCDGIIHNLPDSPKIPTLLESKTANLNNFGKMKNQGLRKSKWGHYVQINIYMKVFGLTQALYIMVCKDDDRRHYELIQYDSGVAEEYIKLSAQIIMRESPPPRISENRESYNCRYCDNVKVCHYGAMPNRSCRTCEGGDICDDGIWRCSKKKKDIGHNKQVKGCKKYSMMKGI